MKLRAASRSRSPSKVLDSSGAASSIQSNAHKANRFADQGRPGNAQCQPPAHLPKRMTDQSLQNIAAEDHRAPFVSNNASTLSRLRSPRDLDACLDFDTTGC